MTDNNHPITPPPELLVQEWLCDDNYPCDCPTNATISIAADRFRNVVNHAARWGADMELEACCEAFEDIWDQEDVVTLTDVLRGIRAARRPKPPTLKEQALAVLDDASNRLDAVHENTIRRALESLPD